MERTMTDEVEKQMEEWDPEKLRDKKGKLKFPIDMRFDGEVPTPTDPEMGEPERRKREEEKPAQESKVVKRVGKRKKEKKNKKLF